MAELRKLTLRIPREMDGMRLDCVLARMFSDYSRARLQQWIRAGQVVVDGKRLRPRDKVRGGERVRLDAAIEEAKSWQAEPIQLAVIYEDEALLVLNKPAGLVVHPGAGRHSGTLLNALLHHSPGLADLPRAGIVHRIDKDTSGLLVVARTLVVQKRLVEQIQVHAVTREYDAVVRGLMSAGGCINAPIGRHSVHRTRMAVTERGKEAVTQYRVIERFRGHTRVKVRLETGRTHQIRVHMAHIRHPIIGDQLYGGRLQVLKGGGEDLTNTLQSFKRQALHAARLGLVHPLTGAWMEWEVPLPEDMQHLVAVLRGDASPPP